MWSYFRHVETLFRAKIDTKETERYDFSTQSWVSIDGNWLLKKRYDGDVFLDALTEDHAANIVAESIPHR